MSKRKFYPDKTDYDALYIWHNDSRISNVSIVERLGHPCTIHSFTRFHVNFLNDMGFVKRWTVLPDWAKFGYEFPVRVRIKIEFADKVDEAIAVAQRIPRVLNFWRVMEEYQLEMTLICENMKECDHMISHYIGKEGEGYKFKSITNSLNAWLYNSAKYNKGGGKGKYKADELATTHPSRRRLRGAWKIC